MPPTEVTFLLPTDDSLPSRHPEQPPALTKGAGSKSPGSARSSTRKLLQFSSRSRLVGEQSAHSRPSFKATGISKWDAVSQIFNLYVGVGIVGVPKAIALGGWISLIAFPILGAAAVLTAHQITQSFVATGADNYSSLGNRAAGWAGEWAVIVIITGMFLIVSGYVPYLAAELLVATVAVFEADLPVWGAYLSTMALCCAIFTVAHFRPAWTLILGNVGAIITAIVILGILGGCVALLITGVPAAAATVATPASTSFFMSTFLITFAETPFNFAGHGFLPMIWREMSAPEDEFDSAFAWAAVLMTSVLTAIGALGYAAFGAAAAQQTDILIAFAFVQPVAKYWYALLMLSLAVKMCITSFFEADAALELVEPRLFARLGWDAADPTRKPLKSALRFSIVIVMSAVTTLALDPAGVDTLMQFVGVLCFMPETYVFPSLFFLLVAWKQAREVSAGYEPSHAFWRKNTEGNSSRSDASAGSSTGSSSYMHALAALSKKEIADEEGDLIKTQPGWVGYSLFAAALVVVTGVVFYQVIDTAAGGA